MPCNSVAVVRARLSAGAFESISTDQRGIEALETWLQQQTGRIVTHRAYGGYLTLEVGSYLSTVTLSASEIAITGTLPGLDQTQLAAFVEQLSVALQQQQLVDALQQSSYVQSDTYDAAGNRVLLVSA